MQLRIARFMWWPPRTLTCWWKPSLFRGEDEYCNPSIAVVIPPFGAFILFWKPGQLRTRPCGECAEFDATEDEFDQAMVEGEPFELEG